MAIGLYCAGDMAQGHTLGQLFTTHYFVEKKPESFGLIRLNTKFIQGGHFLRWIREIKSQTERYLSQ